MSSKLLSESILIIHVVVSFQDDFLSKVNNEFVENGRLEMLSQLHEKEKIAIAALPDDSFQVGFLVGFGTGGQNEQSEVLEGDGHNSKHQMDSSPAGDCQKPEPEEDVNLFIDDVDGQDAEAVLELDRAGGTVVVERALGHFGKDSCHGIDSFFERQLAHAKNIRAISEEFTAQKEVHEVKLEHDVGKVEDFAEDVFGNV